MRLDKDYIKFIAFLAIVIILTPFLMDILSRSWHTELMKSISGTIKSIDPDGVSILINIVAGFYIGSIMLLFIDRYKKVQAILLSIGMYITFSYMSGTFDTNWNIIYIGIGIAIGIVLGSNLRFDEKEKEFKKAANSLSLFSIFYAASSFLIIYLSPDQDNSNFFKDAFTVLIFAFFFGKLMNYDPEGPKIFVLGPAKSGKTMFFAGCYLRALSITEIRANPSTDLLYAIDQIHRGEVPWPERTGMIQEYQFTYEVGTLFPRKTTLRTVDYPGVFLENIPEFLYIEKGINKKDINKMNEEEKRYTRVAQEVADADRFIFIIDGAKYPNFGDMGIIHYIEIISKLNDNGKKIKPYIVVTKSDLFVEEHGNREDYEGFKKFIEKKFSHNIYLKQLLIEASGASFYPVFYHTTMANGEHIPMRDDNGNVYTYGFDKFIDSLSEG